MKRLVAAVASAARDGARLLVAPGGGGLLPETAPSRQVPAASLIPVAEGLRLADPHRPVIAIGGAAEVYGTGLGDLLHAVQRNTGITCLVAENGEYAAPRADLARTAGAAFVAEESDGFRLAAALQEGLTQPGFALIHAQQWADTALEASVIGVAPLITTICTIDPDIWEVIVYGEYTGDDGEEGGTADEASPYGTGS